MAITKPNLPPRTGCVEVAVDRVRMYRDIKTGELLMPNQARTEEPSEQDDAAAMLVDHEYRLTLMELGLMGEGGEE